jgi:lipoprotein-anchoring transpeptidase ErfK/SrfK
VCADTPAPIYPSHNSLFINVMTMARRLHFFLAQAVETKEDAMTALRHNGLAMAAVAVVLAANAAAQDTAKAPAAEQGEVTTAASAQGKSEIVISLEDRKLALIEDGQVKAIYPVAVGKPSTPSPVGTFTIARRVKNPTYSHDGRFVAPGPHNPVGSRWMGLSIRGYGIHGTNEPNSIGKAASHGCIRMAKADLEALYPQVTVGETVELVGQRDAQTAQIFANPAAPATAQSAAQLAKTVEPDAAPVRAAETAGAAKTAAASVAVMGAL